MYVGSQELSLNQGQRYGSSQGGNANSSHGSGQRSKKSDSRNTNGSVVGIKRGARNEDQEGKTEKQQSHTQLNRGDLRKELFVSIGFLKMLRFVLLTFYISLEA